MADYKEQTGVGTSWRRASKVCADNTNGARSIRFEEETVVVLPDGQKLSAPAGGVTAYFNAESAGTVFALRDADGNLTGETATYADVYCMLLSLYYHVGIERDTRAVQVELVPEEPPI